MHLEQLEAEVLDSSGDDAQITLSAVHERRRAASLEVAVRESGSNCGAGRALERQHISQMSHVSPIGT